MSLFMFVKQKPEEGYVASHSPFRVRESLFENLYLAN